MDWRQSTAGVPDYSDTPQLAEAQRSHKSPSCQKGKHDTGVLRRETRLRAHGRSKDDHIVFPTAVCTKTGLTSQNTGAKWCDYTNGK
ncbi:uncharacterized [Tachysurus ichikawai]